MDKKQSNDFVLCWVLTLSLTASLTVITSSVQAADKYWSYTSCGSTWWDNNCWSSTFGGSLDGNGQPLDGDNVYLYNDSSTSYSILYWNTVYTAATLNALSIDATGSGLMTLSYQKDNLTTLSETIGDIGSGYLFQGGGAHSVVGDLTLGNSVTGSGNFSLSNTGTLSAGNIIVGNAGVGDFSQVGTTNTVSDDLTLGSASTGNGSYALSSAGVLSASNITVGNDGVGDMTISSGGSASSTASVYIGRNINSTGTATVTGAGSSLSTGLLIAGGNLGSSVGGTGVLNILNGGSVTSGNGSIGRNVNSNGTVLVNGVGSSWNNSGAISVGVYGTGTLNIENGGDVQSDRAHIGQYAGSQGTVTVTGAGSSWGNNTHLTLGGDGVGALSVENGGMVTSTEDLYIGAGGTGTLSILNGATVSNRSGTIGGGLRTVSCGLFCTEELFFQGNGAATVDGAGSTWNNSDDLKLVNNATLSVLNGGSVTSNTGLMEYGNVTIDGTGSSWSNNVSLYIDNNLNSLNISNGGLFTSGSLGGSGFINISSGGSIVVDDIDTGTSTGTYNISSGGSITSNTVRTRKVTIDGAGSIWTNGDDMHVGLIDVTNGGSIINTDIVGANHYITVDGSGSTLSTHVVEGGAISTIDISNGGSVITDELSFKTVNITNGGTLTSGESDITGRSTIDGIGSVWNNDGGGLNTRDMVITNGGSVTSADAVVDSFVTMSGLNQTNEAASWDVAGALTVNGLLSIGEYANLTVANTTTLNNGIVIDGGDFITGQLNGSLAGSVFSDGTFTVINAGPSLDISGTTLGNTAGGSFSMVLFQDTRVDHATTLTMHNNSNLTTDALVNEGLVSGNGSVNGLVNGGAFSVFTATGGNLTLGNADSFSGFRTQGLINVGTDMVTLHSKQKAQLGYQTELSGGTLTAENGVFLSGASVIVGDGNVNASIAAQTGSTIYASGNLALGDVNKFDGFYSQGSLETNEHVVTINDKNEAVLGSLTTLGNASGAGTLQAANGMLLQQGNNLIGYGTVNGDFINQGHVEETSASPSDMIEFTGNVSGAGDYAGSIMFSGTFNPGNSPALVLFEDIAFGDNSLLNIEIGGLLAGSQYDVLEGREGSSALLSGTLDVDLYDLGSGLFSPTLGDSFDIFKADDIIGEFDLLTLALLGDGLDWQLDYLFDEFGTTDVVRLSVVSVSAVPVPASVWLFGSGLLLLLRTAQRRNAV